MFILQTLKNQLKRKYIGDMIKSRELRVERNTAAETSSMTLNQIFKTVVVVPLDFVCRATIPCCDEKQWSRTRAAFNPLFGVLTMLIGTGCKFLFVLKVDC